VDWIELVEDEILKGGTCECICEPAGFIKQNILPAEDLQASQLCSSELDNL
jgi:hypothetical protein